MYNVSIANIDMKDSYLRKCFYIICYFKKKKKSPIYTLIKTTVYNKCIIVFGLEIDFLKHIQSVTHTHMSVVCVCSTLALTQMCVHAHCKALEAHN